MADQMDEMDHPHSSETERIIYEISVGKPERRCGYIAVAANEALECQRFGSHSASGFHASYNGARTKLISWKSIDGPPPPSTKEEYDGVRKRDEERGA